MPEATAADVVALLCCQASPFLDESVCVRARGHEGVHVSSITVEERAALGEFTYIVEANTAPPKPPYGSPERIAYEAEQPREVIDLVAALRESVEAAKARRQEQGR